MIEFSKNRTEWIFQFAEAGKINYCVLKILKFDILRVPAIKIPTKKVKT
jgi:hypothetical protein